MQLSLSREERRVRDNDDTAHDGMDAALIGIPTRRKAGNCVGTVGFHGSGIEGTPATLFKTSIVGHGMVGWSWVVPPHRPTRGHGDGGRHIVG